MTKPRHIRVRSDIWTHPKTSWMRSIHRDLCCYMAARHHLGVLDVALARVSSDLGESIESIESALGDLADRGVVKPYPALGVWWLTEAADENLDGRSWQTAARRFVELPSDVMADIAQRYGEQLAEHLPEQYRTLVRVSVSEGEGVKNKEALDYGAIAAALGAARTEVLRRPCTVDPDGKAFREHCRKAPDPTTDAWLKAIRRQARSLAGQPDKAAAWLTTSTIHRKANWQRLMERDDLDPTPDTPEEAGW